MPRVSRHSDGNPCETVESIIGANVVKVDPLRSAFAENAESAGASGAALHRFA
jgi:hypothetical protein